MADLDVDRASIQSFINSADTSQANGVVLLTYTVPSGKKARLKQSVAAEASGAAGVRLELVPTGPTSPIRLDTADTGASQTGQSSKLFDLPLLANDVVRWVVNATAVTSTWHLVIGVEERTGGLA